MVTISKSVGVTWPERGYYGYFHLRRRDVSQKLTKFNFCDEHLRWLAWACDGKKTGISPEGAMAYRALRRRK